MKKLNEQKILTKVHLSDAQKLVMAKIHASANANVALEQINNSTNMVAAHKLLTKLGLIQVDDSGATITEKGTKVMSDENLSDTSGSLTDDGQRYADAKDLAELGSKEKEKNEEPVEPDTGQTTGQNPDTDIAESLTLFKDINDLSRFL